MDGSLLIAAGCYLLCALLIVAEVFVPSGGLLSILSVAALGGGLVLFFQQGFSVGLAGVVGALVMIPAVLIGSFKILPYTPFGRSVTLQKPDRHDGDGIPDMEDLAALIDRTGTVLSDLRPVGMCDFDGRKVECIAESGYVDRGQSIRVIRVEGTSVTVCIETI